MMNYTYSRLSAESAAQLIKTHFEPIDPISCEYYILGLHDNYLIRCFDKKYIFRIYRNDWRTDDEIYFELEFLAHLKNSTANASTPVASNSKNLSISIDAPEGKRQAALFPYADGHAPLKNISIEECRLLGTSVAKIHRDSKNFRTQFTRPTINFQYLIDRSLAILNPFLSENQYSYLQNIRSSIMKNTSELNTKNADFGVCIGDVNPSNFHINENGVITHFDFDQCGYGFRAFDLGKFMSSLFAHKEKHACTRAFIQSYENERKLSDIEKKSIPYFEIASVIWVISIHISNVQLLGYKFLESSFMDDRIARIRVLEDELHRKTS